MAQISFQLDSGETIANEAPLLLIAGPCVIESREMSIEVAGRLRDICAYHGATYVFKSSFDKANRSSVKSYRGPGIKDGLDILAAVKEQAGVPVLTDIHEPGQAADVATVVDILQIPAFLCRQTDLLVAAAETGKVVNVKKGQYLAPWDMQNVVSKLAEGGCERVLVTERGATFGYNNLVVDFRSLLYFKEQGWPCCFDATHAVQLPGGQGTSSGGERKYVAGLSRAALSLGIAALFWEVHPCPDKAKCDGPNQLAMEQVEPLLMRLIELDHWAKET